jgi:hypothetical protein
MMRRLGLSIIYGATLAATSWLLDQLIPGSQHHYGLHSVGVAGAIGFFSGRLS